jgi:hypothetical protein
MARPSKPIAKNANSKFVTRNHQQDIFSKFTKVSKPKAEADKATTDAVKSETDDTNV